MLFLTLPHEDVVRKPSSMQRPQPIIFPGSPDLAHEQIYLKTNYGSDRFQGGDFSFHSFGGFDSDMQIISAFFKVR
jgi:hypothetical protein